MTQNFLLVFKGTIGFYKNIKCGYTTLENAEENIKNQIKYKQNSKTR